MFEIDKTISPSSMIKRPATRKQSPVVYAGLVRALIERISTGELPPGAQVPPENDLARAWGISRSSVRLALDALEKQGMLVKKPGKGTFVRNRLEPEVAVAPLRNIGICLTPGKTPWYDGKLIGAMTALQAAGSIRMVVLDSERFGGLTGETVDGMIVAYKLWDRYGVAGMLALGKRGVTPILFNRITDCEDIAYVSTNYREEGRRAVQFLLDSGCSKPLIPVTAAPGLREFGALDALRLESFSDRSIFLPIESNREDDYYCALFRHRLKTARPDALYLPSGSLAVPAFNALGSLGLVAGRDVQLLCFDDIGYLQPLLRQNFHYIRMPLEHMLTDAVEYLLRRIPEGARTPVLKKIYQAEIASV